MHIHELSFSNVSQIRILFYHPWSGTLFPERFVDDERTGMFFILFYIFFSFYNHFFGISPHLPHRLLPWPPFLPPFLPSRRVQWQPNRPLASLTLTCRLPQKRQWQQQQLEKYYVSSPMCLNDSLYHCLDLRYIFFLLFSFLSTNTFFSSGFIIDLLRKNTGDWRKRQRRLEEGRGLRCICVSSPWVWT